MKLTGKEYKKTTKKCLENTDLSKALLSVNFNSIGSKCLWKGKAFASSCPTHSEFELYHLDQSD